jgi:hypothetical protein
MVQCTPFQRTPIPHPPSHTRPPSPLAHLPPLLCLRFPSLSTFIPSLSSVVVFGGSTRNADFFNDVALFSLLTHSWQAPVISSHRPRPRSGHTALLHNGRLLVFGGQHIALPSTSSTSPSLTFFSDVWALDLSSFEWTEQVTKGPTVKRNGHVCVEWRGSLYVMGGSDEEGPKASVMRLDLTTWEWTEVRAVGDEVEGCELHGAASTVDGAGRWWMTGGRSESGVLHSLRSFDLTEGRWRTEGHSPPRCAHSLLALSAASAPSKAATPTLLLFGGTDGLSFFNDLTLHSPPSSPSSSTSLSSSLCPACNGPSHWHRLGGGSKADAATGEVRASIKGAAMGARELSGAWPAARFAASACEVEVRPGVSGFFVFGGMDEERDMDDAALLELKPH